ncbi:Cytochrome c oxidase assembly factor like [Senna tora]|uniref:Cytochrome c oxidase assembly factor like n=1 Tax=Senna tora TaxID=362788 RepID=A0A835CBG7_9FABA|nr:Cytochrome c oxidase assembly factor like [Senna tora]
MDQSLPNRSGDIPPPQPLHQSDADEEDENVKQLDECSSLYLSMQECIVNTNRDWKACQMGMSCLA